MLPEYHLIESEADTMDSIRQMFDHKKIDHTVIKLHKKLSLTQDLVLFFLEVSKKYKESGMSFVVVQNGIDIDVFPDDLNIVPTLQEAEDILEMEAIERDLGF